jgi:hypothetical protein
MARFLHLLKRDSSPLAATVVEKNGREPGAEVTVVLLDDAVEPPAHVSVRRLGGDLDYRQLLELIFASDHVVSW